jgi:hypothetical protein
LTLNQPLVSVAGVHPQEEEPVPSRHTPVQPHRDTFEGEELEAYKRVVARQKAYDYAAFAARVPEEHRAIFAAGAMGAAGEEADPEDRVQPYMGAMLNSPIPMDHLSEMGAFFRRRGEAGNSYAHADREWVDMVLAEELNSWVVYYGHIFDAVAVGVRLEAIRALRQGRDEDLEHDELVKARYIRSVLRNKVTPEGYEGIVELLGRRGAVEYTALIGFLILTVTLLSAFGSGAGFTPELVDDLLDRIEAGTVDLPDASDRIPAATASS